MIDGDEEMSDFQKNIEKMWMLMDVEFPEDRKGLFVAGFMLGLRWVGSGAMGMVEDVGELYDIEFETVKEN